MPLTHFVEVRMDNLNFFNPQTCVPVVETGSKNFYKTPMHFAEPKSDYRNLYKPQTLFAVAKTDSQNFKPHTRIPVVKTDYPNFYTQQKQRSNLHSKIGEKLPPQCLVHLWE